MPTPRSGGRRADPGSVAVTTADAHLLTEVVTRLRRALRASIRTDIPWEALPMAQVELPLESVAEAAPARVSDLAERLHLANSTVSGLIAQMIDSRLVQRHTDPGDRRAAVVTLSAAGQAQLAEWEQAHEQRIGLALEQLPAPDRHAIIQALPALARLTQLLNETGVAALEQTPGSAARKPKSHY